MTVLVTRPSPYGEDLCQLLNQNGISAVHQPLIEFLPNPSPDTFQNQVNQSQMVIFVSQQAVWFTHQLNIEWPKNIQYLAIGESTAKLFKRLTNFSIYYPDDAVSESLLGLDQLQSITGMNVLIVRGSSGRELIYQELTKRGAFVTYHDAYQRRCIKFDQDQRVERWQRDKINTLVITSGEQLDLFYQMCAKRHLSWLLDQTLIVPSQRIQQRAIQLGFQQCIVSDGATNTHILSALQTR